MPKLTIILVGVDVPKNQGLGWHLLAEKVPFLCIVGVYVNIFNDMVGQDNITNNGVFVKINRRSIAYCEGPVV